MTIVPGQDDGWDVDVVISSQQQLLGLELVSGTSGTVDLTVRAVEDLVFNLGSDGPMGPPGTNGVDGAGVVLAKGGAKANTTTWAAQTVATSPAYTMFRPSGWTFTAESFPDYNPTFVTGSTPSNQYAFDLAPPYRDEPGWFIQTIRCQVGFAGVAPPNVHVQASTWWGEFFEATYNVVQPSLASATTLPHVKVMVHMGPFYRPAYDPAQDGYYFGGIQLQWPGTTAIPQSPTGGAQPFCYVHVRRVG